MNVYIGVDLGTSLLRKSTGLACLVEKHGRPTIESPPVHIISEDELIRKCITQMSENFQSRIIAMDAPFTRPEHGTMGECEKRLRKHGIACFPSGAEWVADWVDKAIGLKAWAEKDKKWAPRNSGKASEADPGIRCWNYWMGPGIHRGKAYYL